MLGGGRAYRTANEQAQLRPPGAVVVSAKTINPGHGHMSVPAVDRLEVRFPAHHASIVEQCVNINNVETLAIVSYRNIAWREFLLSCHLCQQQPTKAISECNYA